MIDEHDDILPRILVFVANVAYDSYNTYHGYYPYLYMYIHPSSPLYQKKLGLPRNSIKTYTVFPDP